MKNKQNRAEQNQNKQTPTGKNPSGRERKTEMEYQTKNKPASSAGKDDTTRKGISLKNGIVDLRQLFEAQLQDIYWAEKTLTNTMPQMIQKASSGELAEMLQEHLVATKQHITRCEEVFSLLNLNATGKKCEAMEGLLKEVTQTMDSTAAGSVRDAGIISAAQKVEHYEIASYGTLAAFARQMGESKAVTLLEETLTEEKQADLRLSEMAEEHINEEAEHVYH